MTRIRIMFSRHSAFYSPLVAARAAGFLEAEGIESEFAVAGPARPAMQAIAAGEVEVIQSAVSASFAPLEQDGKAHVVAAVGEAIGPVAFSSLCARRDWLETDLARAFTRAFASARAWVASAPADEIARAVAPFFEGTAPTALERTIADYQRLGTWDGEIAIAPDLYEVALDVFAHDGRITQRHPYDAVVAAPPV